MKRIAFALVALVMLTTTPLLAQAVVDEGQREAIRGIPSRWGVELGSFWQTFSTKVRLQGKYGNGTEIDLEKDLGLLKNLTSFQFGAFYRFSDHSRLDLTYITWRRNHTTTIERRIEWGDVIYDVGVAVTTKTNAQMINAIYEYSFFNNGKVDFGLNGGISSLVTNFSLSGEGTVSGSGSLSGVVAERKKTIFPIPVLGVHFEMTLMKRLFWRAEGNFFTASISGYNGNLNEITTSIAYFPTRNVGVGAGFFSTMYSIKKSGAHGGDLRVRYGFSGVTAYLQFLF